MPAAVSAGNSCHSTPATPDDVRRGHRGARQLRVLAARDRGQHVHARRRDLDVGVRVREATRARRCGRWPPPRRPPAYAGRVVERGVAVVAGRGHEHRAVRGAVLPGVRDGVLERGRRAAAEAHRDHLGALRVRPVDAVGHVRGEARCRPPCERLADRRGSALNATPATPMPLFALARDRAGHVGAVLLSSAQVPLDAARSAERASAQSTVLPLSSGMGLVDAGVDDADLRRRRSRGRRRARRRPSPRGRRCRRRPAAGLAGVVQAVELAEARIVGDRLRR